MEKSNTVLNSNFGVMTVTNSGNGYSTSGKDCLIFGHTLSSNRGLFRNKTIKRPFSLCDRKIFQHVAVYGEPDSHVNGWMMDQASQALDMGWSVLYLDFQSRSSALDLWNNAIKSHSQPTPAAVDSLKDAVQSNASSYFHMDNASLLKFAILVRSRVSAVFEKIHEFNNTLVIIDGVPDGEDTLNAMSHILITSRAAGMALMIRPLNGQQSTLHAIIHLNARTEIFLGHRAAAQAPVIRREVLSVL